MLPFLTFLTIIVLTLKVKDYLDTNNLKFKGESSPLKIIITLLKLFLMCVVPILNIIVIFSFLCCIIKFDEFIEHFQDDFEEIQ